MRLPSQASDPSASASAIPQSSGRTARPISARASSTFMSFGWTRKPCGACEIVAAISRSASPETPVGASASGDSGPPRYAFQNQPIGCAPACTAMRADSWCACSSRAR